ncbi:MAG: 4Fe-4S dicluster domain-containing protein [Actinomycetota bacterium]
MINTVNRELEKEIERRTGQKVRDCYQCRKCSAGCPVAFAMDMLPHEVMKMVQYGLQERLLECSTIWLCASCETCSTRCPNDIDVAGVMDGLRQMALEMGAAVGQPDIVLFHDSFLRGIRLLGRTNETVLMGQYKPLSGKLLDDMGLAAVMMLKGKIKLLPRMVKDRQAVRRIFDSAGKRRG